MASLDESTYARPVVRRERQSKTGVLFINSPTDIGADTWIQLLLMRHLSRERFDLHAAVQVSPTQQPSILEQAVRELPGVTLRPADFGPSSFGISRRTRLANLPRFLPAALSLAGLCHYVRRNGIEIVHSTDRPRDALACTAIAALTSAKSVIHVHVKYGEWMSKAVKVALRRADAVVGVSRFVADSLVAGGSRPERVKAVLNAIEPSRWDPALSPSPGRVSLGVPADAPLILSISRLFVWKGHAQLLRALVAVKQEIPDVRLAIVGADYPEGSGATRELAALARELGVAESVIFTGHRRDIPNLLAACDVFALPSFEEPFGLVYAEAMAMRRPVIGLTNGGTPEVVDDGKSGLLSEPGDIPGLARNLKALLRDPSLRAQMGDYGRLQVESRFAPENMASQMESVYRDLLA